MEGLVSRLRRRGGLPQREVPGGAVEGQHENRSERGADEPQSKRTRQGPSHTEVQEFIKGYVKTHDLNGVTPIGLRGGGEEDLPGRDVDRGP